MKIKVFATVVAFLVTCFGVLADGSVPPPKTYTKAGITAWAKEVTTGGYACVYGSDVEQVEQRFDKNIADIDCTVLASTVANYDLPVVSSQPDKARISSLVAFYGPFGQETLSGYSEWVELEKKGDVWVVPEGFRDIEMKLPEYLRVPVEIQGNLQYANMKVRDDNGNVVGWSNLEIGNDGVNKWVSLPTKLLDKPGELQVGTTYYDEGGKYHFATKSFSTMDTKDNGKTVVEDKSRTLVVEDVVQTTDNPDWTWTIDTKGTGLGQAPLFEHTLTKVMKVKIGAVNDLGQMAKKAHVRVISPDGKVTPWTTVEITNGGYIETFADPGKYQIILDEEDFLRGPGPDQVDPYWQQYYGNAKG